MFINKAASGRHNISGVNIARFRKGMKLSQRAFAELLQLNGLDVDKNAVQRMESGQRFITDIELTIITKTLGRTYEELLKTE